MQATSEVMMLVACALAIYVGLRTLWIFTRTRGMAELFIGVNVISVALGGLVLTVVGITSKTDQSGYSTPAYKVGLAFLALHLLAIYFGTWKVFRPTSRWAAGACLVTLVPICFWYVMASEHAGTVWVRPVLFQSIRGLGMTWSAFECFHHADKLRRQAALGLADPMMAHRFWLWAVGATSALLVCTLELMGWGLSEAAFSAPAAGLMVTAGLGLFGASTVALAFFPPGFYLTLVQRRLGAGSGASRAADGEAG